MGFFKQEYWSGLPCPPPGDLPNPGKNLRLLWFLHHRVILYCWATQENPLRTKIWETVFQTSLRNCPEERGGEVGIHMILTKGYMQSSLHLRGRFLLVTRSKMSPFMTLVLFEIWDDERNSVHQILPKLSNSLKACSASFSQSTVPCSWSPPWIPFGVCWKSAARVIDDLILVELDGEWHPLVGNCIAYWAVCNTSISLLSKSTACQWNLSEAKMMQSEDAITFKTHLASGCTE